MDHLPLPTFSRPPSLLRNAIGNVRQSFQYFLRTTSGFEEFLPSRPGSVSIPHPVSYTERLTMVLGIIISFLEFLCSLEVLCHDLLSDKIGVCLYQPLGRCCLEPKKSILWQHSFPSEH